MRNDLWNRVEALERDLKLLKSLRLEVKQYLSQHPEPVPQGLGKLIGTIEAVVSSIETLSKEQRDALNSIGCDLEIEYACALSEQRKFKKKEKQRVQESIEALYSFLDEQISHLESESYALWDQIGESTGL
ncbi:MAG: hypothetical protein KatS3mg019_2014 [Fimbriimonadales bacterium]|nr:MAG: hypothetical protein KatS3mg019_2014 [Fimbriimonadales bacterium]